MLAAPHAAAADPHDDDASATAGLSGLIAGLLPAPHRADADSEEDNVAAAAGLGGLIAGLLPAPHAAAAADPGDDDDDDAVPALIGDVIIFNDEIVEPVSAPLSTCGALIPLFSIGTNTCTDASRVSDDDA